MPPDQQVGVGAVADPEILERVYMQAMVRGSGKGMCPLPPQSTEAIVMTLSNLIVKTW